MRKYYYNKYLPIMLLAIVVGAISQPMIAYSFTLLDSVMEEGNRVEFTTIMTVVIGVVAAVAFASISHIVKGYISNEEAAVLRGDIFHKILEKSGREFHEKDSGEYYNYVLKKVDIWQTGYFDQFWNIVQKLIEIICILILLFAMNIFAGIVSIVFLIPLALNNCFFPKAIGNAYDKYVAEDSRMVVKLKEYLRGFDSIKAVRGEKLYSKKMNQFFLATNKRNQKVTLLNNFSGSFANICVVLSQAGGIGICLVLLAKDKIGIGQFVALTQLLSYINEPVIDLINATVSTLSIKEINSELNTMLCTDKGMDSFCKTKEVDKLQIKNLYFKYIGKNDYLFENFNIDFEKGKKYLIIGESGSGKSTLVNILMKQIEIAQGCVWVDGNEYSEKDVYSLISIVPQNVFIFSDSIRNNIDLLEKNSDEQVEKVIEIANLKKLVDSKEEKLDSIVDEEILQLSGGERARIGLARALIDKKPILIFDEVLSSLDAENAEKIEKMILAIEDKIVIHIAHKYSPELVERYDQIINLNEKKQYLH